MGIVNRGGTVRISGQAIGDQDGSSSSRPAGSSARANTTGGTTHTGVSGRGTTVTDSTVDGEYIERRQY